MPRALLIANMHSRRCRELAEIASHALHVAGIHLTRPDLPERDQVPDLIRREAANQDLVIVMGGDGTVNMTLDVMQEIGLPLGVLPAGTANDLARTLGVPLDVEQAVKVIAAGHTRAIDVASVNGKPYVNAASFGLTTDITQQLDPKKKKRWGIVAYVLAAWRALRRARGFSAVIEQPGSSMAMRSIQVVVGNGRSFGGGLTVDQAATIDDGVLHVYSIRALPWWKVLLLLPALRFGTHAQSKHVHNAEGNRFEVRTKRPIAVSGDGELLSETPATFTVRRGALRVFTPAEGSAGTSS